MLEKEQVFGGLRTDVMQIIKIYVVSLVIIVRANGTSFRWARIFTRTRITGRVVLGKAWSRIAKKPSELVVYFYLFSNLLIFYAKWIDSFKSSLLPVSGVVQKKHVGRGGRRRR